jgi:PIN domain nuclease of toxin-antitoxin system
MLTVAGRITLDRAVHAWVSRALAHPRTTLLPMDDEVAVAAALLLEEGLTGDPADRIVYATARSLGAPLVSADLAIREFDPARVVW